MYIGLERVEHPRCPNCDSQQTNLRDAGLWHCAKCHWEWEEDSEDV